MLVSMTPITHEVTPGKMETVDLVVVGAGIQPLLSDELTCFIRMVWTCRCKDISRNQSRCQIAHP